MAKRISDKAEVSIDFPDKFYMGTFGTESRFDVNVDADGVHMLIDRGGKEQRHVGFHLHYHLFSDILAALAGEFAAGNPVPAEHRARLGEAATALGKSLSAPDKPSRRRRR